MEIKDVHLKIRKAHWDDLEGINELLGQYDLVPLTLEEMESGIAFLYEEGGRIFGFMWGVVTKRISVVDYLVVDESYRDKNSSGRSIIGLNLAVAFMTEAIKLGVTKLIGIMDQTGSAESMLHFYRNLGMVERVPFAVVKGNPQVIKENLESRLGGVWVTRQ
jgi:N-acetylglutamate synthase-like GNAT family acetyltransferase